MQLHAEVGQALQPAGFIVGGSIEDRFQPNQELLRKLVVRRRQIRRAGTQLSSGTLVFLIGDESPGCPEAGVRSLPIRERAGRIRTGL